MGPRTRPTAPPSWAAWRRAADGVNNGARMNSRRRRRSSSGRRRRYHLRRRRSRICRGRRRAGCAVDRAPHSACPDASPWAFRGASPWPARRRIASARGRHGRRSAFVLVRAPSMGSVASGHAPRPPTAGNRLVDRSTGAQAHGPGRRPPPPPRRAPVVRGPPARPARRHRTIILEMFCVGSPAGRFVVVRRGWRRERHHSRVVRLSSWPAAARCKHRTFPGVIVRTRFGLAGRAAPRGRQGLRTCHKTRHCHIPSANGLQ